MKVSKLSLLAVATLSVSHAVNAFEKGDWVVRAGLATVAPDESSSNIVVGGNDLGVNLTVDNNTQLGLNFAYFFTDNMNIEVLAATPFKHDVNFGVSDAIAVVTPSGTIGGIAEGDGLITATAFGLTAATNWICAASNTSGYRATGLDAGSWAGLWTKPLRLPKNRS